MSYLCRKEKRHGNDTSNTKRRSNSGISFVCQFSICGTEFKDAWLARQSRSYCMAISLWRRTEPNNNGIQVFGANRRKRQHSTKPQEAGRRAGKYRSGEDRSQCALKREVRQAL